MPYDRGYIRDYALIRGITLLETTIKGLQKQEIKLANISIEWIRDTCPAIGNQIQMINMTSAKDIASKFLVKKLNKLNDHLLSEFPYLPRVLRLSREALHALNRAYQAHSHIWNQAKFQSIITALGSSNVVKTKKLPYYDYDDDEEEEERKKERKIKILEYKPLE